MVPRPDCSWPPTRGHPSAGSAPLGVAPVFAHHAGRVGALRRRPADPPGPSEQRWRFLKRNWMDVATLAVPMLRPLRALRVVVALNVLGRRGRTFARGRVVVYVANGGRHCGFVASLAVLDAERASPEANIRTFGDALWWAATTVTTVGYGDRFPTTTEGRIVAVA